MWFISAHLLHTILLSCLLCSVLPTPHMHAHVQLLHSLSRWLVLIVPNKSCRAYEQPHSTKAVTDQSINQSISQPAIIQSMLARLPNATPSSILIFAASRQPLQTDRQTDCQQSLAVAFACHSLLTFPLSFHFQ
jgi:hypothetical protein